MSWFNKKYLPISDKVLRKLSELYFPFFFQVSSQWTLPYVICDIYMTMDVICSTASIFNLVAISLDR